MKYYEVKFYIQGTLHKSKKFSDEFDYDYIERIYGEIQEKYKGYKKILSTSEGRFESVVLFNEVESNAVCISYRLIEYTEFYDCHGTPIKLGDKLVPKCIVLNPEKFTYRLLRYNSKYYLQKCDKSFTFGPCEEIHNITQEILSKYVIL